VNVLPLTRARWHANIKPENILSVRGRLKLAGFGLSSFAFGNQDQNGSKRNEIEKVFTDTYGKPVYHNEQLRFC